VPEYRRHRIAGGTYFFTVVLSERRSDLLVREIGALRQAVARTRFLYNFHIDAWVVLPDHLHAVWTLPAGDAAFAHRWTLIKRWFSAALPHGEGRSASRVRKGERGVWQRRFWEHAVRDEEDYARHVDYVHRGGRLGRDSVSVSISGASAGWWDHLPLPGRCGGRA
jgi:putative transposase